MEEDKYLDEMLSILEVKVTDKDLKEDIWKQEFIKSNINKWLEKVGSIESKYLISRLKKKDILNCYEIESIITLDSEKIVFWVGDVSSMCVDAIAIPATFDICDSSKKNINELYYHNGMKLRKKCLDVMEGSKLDLNEVLITRSYNIPTDYIIHVNYGDIIKSIINILDCARINMVKTLVICLDEKNVNIIKKVYDITRDYLDKFGIMFHKIIFKIDDDIVEELSNVIGDMNA